jgi:hypothetical protein
MKPVEREEVLGLAEYETVRGPFRSRVIEEKKRRRVSLGPRATAVFENHDTVLLQVQEMLRTERITREAAVQHEIETYNQLVPESDELSATLMVEIPDAAEREAFLASAAGLENHIALVVDERRIPARFDPSRVLPDRASAVLYLKFALPQPAAAAIRQGKGKASLTVDHPAYAATAELGPAVRASLAEDLG